MKYLEASRAIVLDHRQQSSVSIRSRHHLPHITAQRVNKNEIACFSNIYIRGRMTSTPLSLV